jgi:hypothetical protein
MKKSDYEKLNAKIKRKFSKLKMELDDQQIKLDELDELVEEKARGVIKRKLIKQVLKAIQTNIDELEQKLLYKVSDGYFDYIRDQAASTIKNEFYKGVNFKHKVIHSDVLHTHDPIGMLNDGWRITYVGPLQFEQGKKKDVFIFEKSALTKKEAKVKILTKSKKVKNKKKINRNPV